jgi:hypothetical protein
MERERIRQTGHDDDRMGSDLEAARHRVAEQLATRVHAWADATKHDPGVTLLELMAFVADALSGYQDAVADEARLLTPRRRPTVRLEVDGEIWRAVPSLDDSGPTDRDFVVTVDADGGTAVRFGDGVQGQRLPTGAAAVRTEYRTGLGFVGVRLQQGRVSVDADWNEASDPGRLYGVYRGVVVDNVDPQQERRLLVRASDMAPDPLGWALPALTATKEARLPAPGDPVWVLFEAGDPGLPVWLA